ncbi:MAG: UvrD-helicase domain-containing protein, partial [Myxococcota bacterium]
VAIDNILTAIWMMACLAAPRVLAPLWGRARKTPVLGKAAIELATEVQEEVTKRLRAEGKASFDELLRALKVALSKPGADGLQRQLSSQYRAALIDEFQDTDPQQYEIFHRLFASSTLVLIGDPKQAIYGFRGADLFAYLRAAREVGDARYGLPVNYRSDPSVLRAVETLFRREPEPFVFEDLEFPTVRARPGASDAVGADPLGDAAMTFVVETESSSTDKAWAVSTSVRLIAAILAGEMTLSGREVEPGDFAILTRTNRMSLELQSALRERGIPAVYRGDRSVFETPAAEDLQVVLAGLLQPHAQRTLRAALLTGLLGYSADPLLGESESELAEHANRFLVLRDRWRTGGIALALEGLCSMYRVEQRMLVRSYGQRTLTDFLHLRELLHRAQHRHRLGPERLADWLRRRRSEPSRLDQDDESSVQMRLDSDEAAVQLFTIHTAKGLEFPLVVCPELGSVAHEPRRGPIAFHREDAMVLDLAAQPAAAHLEAARLEWRAEARRLLYVALTRAKHRIYVPWPRGRELAKSALGSLIHDIDPETPSDIVRDLESLCSVSEGSIGYRDVESIPDVRFRGRKLSRTRRRARRAPRVVQPQKRTSSYSGWVQGLENVDEGRDSDRDVGKSQVLLSRFEPGASTGLLVHAVLEAAMSAELPSLVEFTRTALKRYGHEESKLPDLLAVVEAVRELKLDLGDRTSRFGEANDGVAEFEFALRIAGRSGWQARIEAAMQRAGGIYAIYAERFASLSSSVLPGMLRGYIDWVGALAGHSLVVDYKTNAIRSYDSESLSKVMVEHDYVLQALLYSVALRRYLSLRGRDTGFGGAHYVFVRGLRPGHGVFSIHPPERLLAVLERELVGDDG